MRWWSARSRRAKGGIIGAAVLVVLIVVGSLAGNSQTAKLETTGSTSTGPRTVSTLTTSAPTTAEASATAAPSTTTAATVAPTSTAAPAPAPGTALDALATLPVKGRAAKTGYSRDQFGPAWSDVDHNGCDTRNDILNRDLTNRSWREGTHNCVVIAGTLNDPYTGAVIQFEKADAGAVQIDHVVALSDAWQKGAQALDAATRLRFANDPLNLLAVGESANAAKGDGDAATWLPPDKAYRCRYVARQVTVKVAYHLWVTKAEHDAIVSILTTCPAEPLASGTAAATPAPTTPGTAPAPTAAPPTTSGGSVYYANCDAARAAGAAPIHRGDPGYRSALDRDGDGVACE